MNLPANEEQHGEGLIEDSEELTDHRAEESSDSAKENDCPKDYVSDKKTDEVSGEPFIIVFCGLSQHLSYIIDGLKGLPSKGLYLLSSEFVLIISEAPKPTSLMWRLGSGLYGTTTGVIGGAVGLGTGSVKWVAGKSYDAGSAVLSTTVNTTKTIVSYVPKPTLKRKDKKE